MIYRQLVEVSDDLVNTYLYSQLLPQRATLVRQCSNLTISWLLFPLTLTIQKIASKISSGLSTKDHKAVLFYREYYVKILLTPLLAWILPHNVSYKKTALKNTDCNVFDCLTAKIFFFLVLTFCNLHWYCQLQAWISFTTLPCALDPVCCLASYFVSPCLPMEIYRGREAYTAY